MRNQEHQRREILPTLLSFESNNKGRGGLGLKSLLVHQNFIFLFLCLFFLFNSVLLGFAILDYI